MKLPYCEICGKEVERIEMHEDFKLSAKVYTVYCHGDKETTQIERRLEESCLGIGLGTAFRKKHDTVSYANMKQDYLSDTDDWFFVKPVPDNKFYWDDTEPDDGEAFDTKDAVFTVWFRRKKLSKPGFYIVPPNLKDLAAEMMNNNDQDKS